MLRLLPAALAAAVCCSLSTTPLAAQRADPAEGYGVRSGDRVITDFYTAGGERLAAVAGSRLVDRAGNVFFPYIGTVTVEGLGAEAIRVLLVDRFEPFYTDPVVTVNVELRVNVTGVVGSPGHYFLDPSSTIVDALATAGGVGLEVAVSNTAVGADVENVRLVRDGETTILNLRPEAADPAMLEMHVQSGDWIHVPPQPRSRVRDEVQFWGSVLSFVTSVVAVVAIIAR